MEKSYVVLSNGAEIPANQLSEYQKREAELNARLLAEAQENAHKRRLLPSCPFTNAIDTTCREDCALHVDGGCALAKLIKGTPAATEGKRCPITRNLCNKTCALNENGCKLTAI